MRPSGLESLCEEGPQPSNTMTGAFPSCNGASTYPHYARVSKISVDSFESSSTSSGECYENLPKDYVNVTPDPLPLESFVGPSDASKFSYVPFHSGQTSNLQNSDDDELYSPVSPDWNSVSEDDCTANRGRGRVWEEEVVFVKERHPVRSRKCKTLTAINAGMFDVID